MTTPSVVTVRPANGLAAFAPCSSGVPWISAMVTASGCVTSMAKSVRAVAPSASVTVAVTSVAPASVGEPVIFPVSASRVSPAGSALLCQVYGGVPPAAERLSSTASPTV